jgi:hypothetical protein
MEQQQQQTVDLKAKSVVELKALAYDLGIMVNEYRNMLNIVNQEILDRSKSTVVPNSDNDSNKTDDKVVNLNSSNKKKS